MKALLMAVLLSAVPFPAPKMIQVTDRTKCDWGPIASITPNGQQLVLTTPAGPVTYNVGLEVQVFGADGKPLGAVTVLRAGQTVRIYYTVEATGAKADEIDVQQ
jgi:hypothetical protein